MPKVRGREFTAQEKDDFILSSLNAAARKKKHGKGNEPPHVRLYDAVRDSKAWRALSHAAARTYLEFLYVWWHNMKDKKRLNLSYPWLLEHQGICMQTAARAFTELDALGFIERPAIEDRGGLFGRICIYRLSQRWQALEHDPAAMRKALLTIAAYDKARKRQRPPGDIKRLLKWRSDRAPTERQNQSP